MSRGRSASEAGHEPARSHTAQTSSTMTTVCKAPEVGVWVLRQGQVGQVERLDGADVLPVPVVQVRLVQSLDLVTCKATSAIIEEPGNKT